MKSQFKIVFSLAVISVTVFLLCLLRNRNNTAQLWSGYNVLYIENTVSEDTVLDCLRKNGCKDVISRSLQSNPFKDESGAFGLFIDNSYLQDRLQYFTDRSQNFNLFYVPQNEKTSALKALDEIESSSGNNVKSGIDVSTSYPFIIPLISLFLFIFLSAVAENHIVCFLAGLFPVLYSFIMPDTLVSSACCLLLLGIFIMQRMWFRRESLATLLLNIYTTVLILAFLAFSFLSSRKAFVLSVLVLLGIYFTVVILREVQKNLEGIRGFKYINIDARLVPSTMTKKVSLCFIAVLVPLFLLFLYEQKGGTVTESGLEVSIPAPVKEATASENLVNLEDCYEWAWNTVTFPYRNLNESLENKERIVVPHYISTADGIEKADDVVYEYNESFKNDVENRFENLDNPSIEHLLNRQKGAAGFCYTDGRVSGSEENPGNRNKILLMIALAIPLMLFVYYYIIGRKCYESSK